MYDCDTAKAVCHKGALLVAPADTEAVGFPGDVVGFGPIPLQRLPFRSTVVASTDDPCLTPERAELFARSWGSKLVFVREEGHINADAGFGPWPFGEELLAELVADESAT